MRDGYRIQRDLLFRREAVPKVSDAIVTDARLFALFGRWRRVTINASPKRSDQACFGSSLETFGDFVGTKISEKVMRFDGHLLGLSC